MRFIGIWLTFTTLSMVLAGNTVSVSATDTQAQASARELIWSDRIDDAQRVIESHLTYLQQLPPSPVIMTQTAGWLLLSAEAAQTDKRDADASQCQQALQLDNGDKIIRARATLCLGIAQYLKDEPAQAEIALRQAISVLHEQKLNRDEATALNVLGRDLLELDRPAAAVEIFNDALKIAIDNHEGPARILAILGLAMANAQEQQPQQALAFLDQARTMAANESSLRLVSDLHRDAAQVFILTGDYRRAYQALEALRLNEATRAEARNKAMLVRLRTQLALQHQDAEHALLTARQQTQQAELNTAQAQRWAMRLSLLLGAGLVSALGILLSMQIRQHRRFADLAMRDELTQAPNRRHILRWAAQQLEASRKSGLPLCIAALDIDHFKQINDTFGHDAGDMALKTFAQAVSAGLRGDDRIGRTGGEEWMLVMPGTTLAQAESVFGRLRDTVQANPIPGLPDDYRLAFSMGACAAADGCSLEQLIARADSALYRAKENGRNRIELEPHN